MDRKLLVLVLSLFIAMGTLSTVPGAQAATVDWVLEGQMPVGLSEFVSAELPDGRIFVALGYDPATDEFSDRAYLFDPYQMTWTEVASAPVALAGATCAYLDGTVFVFGGRFTFNQYEPKMYMYDVAGDDWAVGPAMPESGMNIQSAVIGEHQILVVGLSMGYNQCYSFDTNTRDFTVRDDFPGARRGAAMVRHGYELLFFGGYDTWHDVERDIFRYDIPGNEWSYVGQMPVFLAGHTAVLGSDGLVYLMGGSYFGGQESVNFAESSLAYDVSGNSFIELPVLVEPFRFGAVCELEDGRILVWGGNDNGERVTGVHSLQAWEMDVSLSSDSVGQGGNVWLSISLQTNFAPTGPMQGKAVISSAGVSYAVYDLYSNSGSTYLSLSIPEDLPPAEYLVEIVGLGSNEGQDFQVEPMPLTISDAPSMGEQLQQTQQELDEALEELRAAKLEATIGYVTLVLALAALVIAIVVLMRRK